MLSMTAAGGMIHPWDVTLYTAICTYITFTAVAALDQIWHQNVTFKENTPNQKGVGPNYEWGMEAPSLPAPLNVRTPSYPQ